MFVKFKKLFLRKILNKNLKNTTGIKFFFYKVIKIFTFSFYNFFKHNLSLLASALTYYSLLAIVPFFALIFAIAKKIGYQENIEQELIERFVEQKEIIIKIVEFAKNLIVEAKGGLIALFGIIFLFWSLIKLFSNLENSLNRIWKVEKFRKLKRRIGSYLSLIVIIPIFLITFVALKIYVLSFFSQDLFFEKILKVIFNLTTYFLILTFFTFLYVFIPKIKIKIKYAFLSAIVSSFLYQLMQILYLKSQIGITRFNAIYGSFAALPLFLIWLQISWLIFLYGSELNYVLQNLNKIKYISKKI